MDAGAAGRLLTEHLLDAFEHTTVARFNTDRLLDYRSRRPLMTFDDGKWETYDAPELSVFRLADAEGKPFLLLTGPEPDHEWEAFVAAAQTLAERLGAGPMITYFGVPMGIPHTRPLGVITHATRPGLVTSKMPLPSKLQVPALGVVAHGVPVRRGRPGRDRPGRPGAALPVAGRLPDRGADPDRRADRGRPGLTCPRSSCARRPTGPTR